MQLDTKSQKELSIFDMFSIFRDGWRIWMGFMLVGGVIAYGLLLVLPKQYEATTFIKIGQVGQVSNIFSTGLLVLQQQGAAPQTLESPALAAASLKMPGFLQDFRVDGNAIPVARLIANIDVRVVQGIDLVEVRYRDTTAEATVKGINVLFKLLEGRHAALAAPKLQALRIQLQQVKALRHDLSNGQASDHATGGAQAHQFNGVAGEANKSAFVGRDAELVRWQYELEQALLEPATQPTRLYSPVVVSDSPVKPAKLFILAFGILGGFMLGVVIVAIRASLRAHRLLRE